jgi:hypothetical protein
MSAIPLLVGQAIRFVDKIREARPEDLNDYAWRYSPASLDSYSRYRFTSAVSIASFGTLRLVKILLFFSFPFPEVLALQF